MALLARGTAAGVFVGVFLVATACVMFGGVRGARPYAFPHRVHVVDQGLDCTDCHRTAETGEDPGMPALRQCQLCHEELDANKPSERKVEALFDGKAYKTTPRRRLPDEVHFSHVAHIGSLASCDGCHGGLVGTAEPAGHAPGTKAACQACHEGKVDPGCATCHAEIRSDVPPNSHDGSWLRFHGSTVHAATGATADRCDLCHEKTSCQTCHQDALPASHNQFFRRRGHGLIARLDRQSCTTCHRTDSCSSCHEQARPVNHIGSFGGGRSQHCISCHQPLAASDCATCHKATPSHDLAPPMPQGHVPGMNCRQCHGLTAPLRHVDNGDSCSSCHR